MPAGDIAKNHPQVALITEMLLDGRSPDEIATKLDPYISRVSISNFFRYQVKPALKNAERLAAIEKARARHEKLPDLMHGDGSLNDAEASELVKEAFGAGVVLAARNRRLAELQAVSDALDEVQASRADDLTDRAPGGHTGLLVERVKAAGVEYLLDKVWIDAKLEISRRIAEETGQWQDGGSSGVTVNIVVPGQLGGNQSGRVVDIEPISIPMAQRR